MRILFHLGHPAHYHLFKNVIKRLIQTGHHTFILIKKKDILEELLNESDFEFYNILPKGRKDNKLSMLIGQFTQDIQMLIFCAKKKPNILIGSSVAISHVGKFLRIPAICLTEDDIDVVPLFAKLTYPWISNILAPGVCRMGKWGAKTITYEGYHELAYLHPANFSPNIEIVKKYISLDKNFFILRFAKLGAHHDAGIKGISNEIAIKLIDRLKYFGSVYITSERVLVSELEQYRISINPIDMHHIIAFASLYIGDSQTMAAEAGVLGVPFIRFNDFVGRISYLEELENNYKLGFGIKTNQVEELFVTVEELLVMSNRYECFQKRKKKMLSEKINYASFLSWFIENYPYSVKEMKENPEYQRKFS